MPKVSVIVTIYNAGKYLIRCLDSLQRQTLRDVEFILVLDCPTDGSDIIAKEYSKKDSRFNVIENNYNRHIGESRNIGILAASGEFISFVDHDDICEYDMLELLYKEAEFSGADMVFSPIAKYYKKNQTFVDRELSIEKNVNIRLMILRQILASGDNNSVHFKYNQVHGAIYKSSIIKNNIVFVNTREILPEDSLFNAHFLMKADIVSYVNKPLYRHVSNEINASSMLSYYDWEKRVLGFETLYNYLVVNRLLDDYNDYFMLGVKRSSSFLFLTYCDMGSIYKWYRVVMQARKNKMIKKAFSYKDTAKYSIKVRLLNYISSLLMQV